MAKTPRGPKPVVAEFMAVAESLVASELFVLHHSDRPVLIRLQGRGDPLVAFSTHGTSDEEASRLYFISGERAPSFYEDMVFERIGRDDAETELEGFTIHLVPRRLMGEADRELAKKLGIKSKGLWPLPMQKSPHSCELPARLSDLPVIVSAMRGLKAAFDGGMVPKFDLVERHILECTMLPGKGEPFERRYAPLPPHLPHERAPAIVLPRHLSLLPRRDETWCAGMRFLKPGPFDDAALRSIVVMEESSTELITSEVVDVGDLESIGELFAETMMGDEYGRNRHRPTMIRFSSRWMHELFATSLDRLGIRHDHVTQIPGLDALHEQEFSMHAEIDECFESPWPEGESDEELEGALIDETIAERVAEFGAEGESDVAARAGRPGWRFLRGGKA